MAEAIPVFNYLLALNASVCFAPLAIMLPGGFWLYDNISYRQGTTKQKLIYWSHWLLPIFGAFFLVGGTYATVKSIVISNQAGGLGKCSKQTCRVDFIQSPSLIKFQENPLIVQIMLKSKLALFCNLSEYND
jgi:hypothetical protein